jgi:putative aminopeptidase FrvX
MIKIYSGRSFTLAALVLTCLTSAFPQQTSPELNALVSWVTLDATPGWEHLATDVLLKTMPEWKRDALGNLILRKGSSSPRRVVACGIDRPGFAVTEITDDGYLRMREVGSLRPHPLWVQFHEGQRIRIVTRSGDVPGVVTVKSTHLQRGRAPNAPVATLDDLWIDVGGTSRSDVERLGIRMLDPIVHDFVSWTYAQYVAGPSAATRVGCAAVASASRGEVTSGETIFLITTLRSFGQDGLAAALRSLGKVDEITILDEPSDNTSNGLSQRTVEKPPYLPDSTGLTSLNALAPRTRFSRTLVESVHIADARELLIAVEKAAGVQRHGNSESFLSLATNSKVVSKAADTFSNTADLLKSVADIPGVSGHEREVLETIMAALPQWARKEATIDSQGNLIVQAGPKLNSNTVQFIAHMDEVGFEITNIADDGTVSLRTRGGMFQSLWEGQPALLHFDRKGDDTRPKPPLHGVFVPRDTASTKQPESLTSWFGVDGSTLKGLGVSVGQSVTADKHATRLGATRFTARALDDRAGSTALILAARRINPATLKHRLILSWSVREETGLEGAIGLARTFGQLTKRVFSIDTFVSSDSPAESTRFAFAPLGRGAVIRGLDNSSIADPSEVDRIVRLAQLNQIPLQVGATNGGTDGSEFVPYGAIHVSLSWPGRYSHSPVEVLDLRDLDALTKLITALALENAK